MSPDFSINSRRRSEDETELRPESPVDQRDRQESGAPTKPTGSPWAREADPDPPFPALPQEQAHRIQRVQGLQRQYPASGVQRIAGGGSVGLSGGYGGFGQQRCGDRIGLSVKKEGRGRHEDRERSGFFPSGV
jgi:hypothetical protein